MSIIVGETHPQTSGSASSSDSPDAAAARVSELQRLRLVSATVTVASERGFEEMSVARVLACAGVSRSTFYEHFDSREDCFLAALEETVHRVGSPVIAVYRHHRGGWSERLRSSLETLLEQLDADPDATRVIFLEAALGAGPRVETYTTRLLGRLRIAVDRGRTATREGARPFPLAAEAIVGGVLAVIRGRLLEEHSESLVTLLNPLMSMIVATFEGPSAAAVELRYALPEPSPAPARRIRVAERASVPAPKSSNGRAPKITYRTVRVLEAIAEHPGADSREIARAAGISDQSQISKLLARLERQELIAGTSYTDQGKPSAWKLTAHARMLEQAFRMSPRSGLAGCPQG
jgi:AcrR family transcriptional regulator/DNA-binding MarR family transcriptional regulator